MPFDPNEISRLLRSRRSVYPAMYTGEVVDDSIIKDMLENANWAPTHKLTEPWRFTVFAGNGLKKLATFQSELYKKKALASGNFSEEKYTKLSTKPLLCSHIISIGMKREENESIPEIEEISAVASAVQNMQLTATGHGVGCYWGSGGVTYMDEAKTFFGLETKDLLLGFLYIGIPKKNILNGKRQPIGDKVRWIE